MFGHEWRRQLNGTSNPQVGVVVFFSGLVLSWAKSWSSPPPPPSPAHSKGSPERLDWADVADEPDAAWDVNEEPPRARRESLWEEAEIEGLDVTERAERWEAEAESEPPTLMRLRSPVRRGNAMSLLGHLLGRGLDQRDAGRDTDGRASPLEMGDADAASVGIGGDAAQSDPANKPARRVSQEQCPLLPPDGPL